MEDLSSRVTQIKAKSDSLNEKKIRLEERLKSEKASLAKLVKEIKAKGYDPKKLKEIVSEKEKELRELVTQVATTLDKAEEVLEDIESKDATTFD